MTREFISPYVDSVCHESVHSYSAARGLLWSHMGWIFFKDKYERLELIDKADLDKDSGAFAA